MARLKQQTITPTSTGWAGRLRAWRNPKTGNPRRDFYLYANRLDHGQPVKLPGLAMRRLTGENAYRNDGIYTLHPGERVTATFPRRLTAGEAPPEPHAAATTSA